MRRTATLLSLTSLLGTLLLVLPVRATAAPTWHAVPDRTRSAALALGDLREGVRAAPELRAAFSGVGATWDAGTLGPGRLEVRTHGAGSWSGWTALPMTDAGPDDGSKDARSAARHQSSSDPLWVGPSDRVQLRVRGTAAPRNLHAVLVDPGTSAADANPSGTATAASSAEASEAQPAILSRARWGANEALRTVNDGCATPDYSGTVKVGFVHHTDNSNSYSAAQVPALIRSIYAYHVRTKGWCDVGYNFLVDRFGRVWEGRAGGLSRAVIGAHTGGFNRDSFAAALIGNYSSATPSSPVLSALEKLFAWKLGLHQRDPLGTQVLTSAGGGTSRYTAGTQVRFHVVSGHRDAGYTDCPGLGAYRRIGEIRTRVRAFLGAGLVDPVSSRPTTAAGGPGPIISARVLKAQSWKVVLRRTCDGRAFGTWTGSAGSAFAVRPDTGKAPAGLYTVEVSGAAGSDPVVPFRTPLELTSSTPAPPVQKGTGTAPGPGSFVATDPLRVLDTRGGSPLSPRSRRDVQVTGATGVPSGAVAVAVNLTALCATAPTNLTAYPADSAQPGTSSLSASPGSNRSGLVQIGLSPAGQLSIANLAGYVDVVADVVGWFAPSPVLGTGYHPSTAGRLLDTRTAGRRLAAGGTVTVPTGLPASATAAVVNVSAVNPSAAGFLMVHPSGGLRPSAATVTFPAGRSTSSRVITKVSSGGLDVTVAGASTDVVVDLVGWYGRAGGSGLSFTPVRPTRVVDTRTGTGVAKGRLTTRPVTLAVHDAPASATAVVMTLTAANATTPTYLSVWGRGVRPATSDLSVLPGSSTSNLVVLALSDARTLTVQNAAGSVDLIGDVVGYF